MTDAGTIRMIDRAIEKTRTPTFGVQPLGLALSKVQHKDRHTPIQWRGRYPIRDEFGKTGRPLPPSPGRHHSRGFTRPHVRSSE